MTFLEWLDDEHHRVATEYRIELYKEIQHCKRIFGKITPDAKEMLIKALREIPHPAMEKYKGNDATMQLYKSAPKVDFLAIFNEAVDTI